MKAWIELGQVFLQDPTTINKIVDGLNLNKQDIILEIGPGQGAITEKIVDKVYSSHLVEIDKALSLYLKQKKYPNTYLYNQDFLKWKWPIFPKPIKVVSALPYGWVYDILHKLIPNQEQISKMVLSMTNNQARIITNEKHPEGNLIRTFFNIEDSFHIPKSSFNKNYIQAARELKVETTCIILKNKKA